MGPHVLPLFFGSVDWELFLPTLTFVFLRFISTYVLLSFLFLIYWFLLSSPLSLGCSFLFTYVQHQWTPFLHHFFHFSCNLLSLSYKFCLVVSCYTRIKVTAGIFMLLFVCFIGSLRTLQEITTKMGLWGSNYDEKLIKLINCNLEFEWKELFQVISTPISSGLYYLGCNKVWSLNWNQIIYGKLFHSCKF